MDEASNNVHSVSRRFVFKVSSQQIHFQLIQIADFSILYLFFFVPKQNA